VTKDTENKHEQVIGLTNYLHQRLYFPPRSIVTDVHQLHNLVRNVAACDSQASVLVALARKIGLDGGWGFMAENRVENIGHSFGLVYIDGKYRMVDPLMGHVFINKDGTLATVEDISTRPEQLKSKQHKALKWLIKQGLSNVGFGDKEYIRLFDHHEVLKINILAWPGFQRKLVSSIIDKYYESFGEWFLIFFEELYFLVDDTPYFLKARLKHVSFRYESAINDYDNILLNKNLIKSSRLLLLDYGKVSEEVVASEVIFFKGMAFWENKDFARSAETFESLLMEYPSSRWIGLIHYYLGDSYENLNEIEKAVYSYKVITIDTKSEANPKLTGSFADRIPFTPAPIRLHHLIKGQG
jgi:hypothetical protein